MKMKTNKINKKSCKIFILIASLSLSNMLIKAGELEDLISNYYNNKEYNLINESNKNIKTYDLSSINSKSRVDFNKKIDLSKFSFKLTQEELMKIAEQIYLNETGGKKEELVTWNAGENFPSLGIGHFIWSKSSNVGVFGESLPGLVEFYKKEGVELPRILAENRYSPWSSRSELLRKRNNGDRDIRELIEFFDNTREIQILYIYNRLENSLEKMLQASYDKENLKYQFYRVANSENGLYALIDYVNFKGEGISTSSSYNYQGWGLRQVLENMSGKEEGKAALVEFSNSAKEILSKRVKNAPRNENQWLVGWFNRADTYKEFVMR